MVDYPKLGSFVEPRSLMLFNILRANGTWLQNDVSEWHQNEKNLIMKDLKVVIDLAEHCIKYM